MKRLSNTFFFVLHGRFCRAVRAFLGGKYLDLMINWISRSQEHADTELFFGVCNTKKRKWLLWRFHSNQYGGVTMQPVSSLCTPRKTVYSDAVQDYTLNLTNLREGSMDPASFFAENFQTAGMKTLFETAFRRFAGKSETGVIKLTQAMGGGKTHNMIALALLAQYPEWRSKVLGSSYDDLGDIEVVAFSGRESDAAFGIWGSIAEQLGRKEFLAEHYAPLRAPGETAWINLLSGKRILILLDELPPYLENAKATVIGNSDLCTVTTTALANLFNAIGKAQLANVCLVISDLRATYESGSQLLASSFLELESELSRVSTNLEPVALNTDEVFDILRTRLFERVAAANSPEVNAIAIAYKDALTSAGKSGLTGYTGDAVYLGIRDSYPFHPSIKDLYARFKENPGFQQTRGLIRLMRQVVRGFYASGNADKQLLINVYDVDLNNNAMLAMVKQIKPSLEVAISYDIAQAGRAIAEVIDARNGESQQQYAQDVAKLLLLSSLNDTPQGVMGLSQSDALGYLCKPGVDLNSYKRALGDITSECWYIKTDSRGRIFFQNTRNMIAELNSLVDGYSVDTAKAELRKYLESIFDPKLKSCYNRLYVLPAIDEINIEQHGVALIIFEPYAGNVAGGLHPDLQSFYDNCRYKNRLMFLSGQRNLMEKLVANAKRFTAIKQIMTSLRSNQVPESDQQFREAEVLLDKANQVLLQTIRETFVTLTFPARRGLAQEQLIFEFVANKFDGEDQVIKALIKAKKYESMSTDPLHLEEMRQKAEERIFTQKEMPWSLILERAATETMWQWYHSSQMEALRKHCINADIWREIGGYLSKGPFAKDATNVVVEQTSYNEETGEFTLRVRPVRGNVVYYAYDAEPTSASNVAAQTITIRQPSAYFICEDKTDTVNPHPQGEAVAWVASVPLKRDWRTNSAGFTVLELKTHKDFYIRYTTDGSNPKENGNTYSGEIVLPADSRFVRVAVYYNGNVIQEEDLAVVRQAGPGGGEAASLEIDDHKPIEYTMPNPIRCSDTERTYAEIASLLLLPGSYIGGYTVTISQKDQLTNFFELTSSNIPWDVSSLREIIDQIRTSAFSGRDVEVELEYKTIQFVSGAAFKQWIDTAKIDLSQISKKDIKQ